METATNIHLKKQFKSTFNHLRSNRQKVLLLRLKGKKLNEIAKELGITPARVYQIEQAAWLQIESEIRTKIKPDNKSIDLVYFLENDSNLSKRTHTALVNNNILTLKDLFSMKEENLPKLKGIGDKAITEIMSVAEMLKNQKVRA